ncbi:ABC transporter permease [Lentibacillus amyloliquefaciens]|uniref:Nitrate ABC transporter permease n=1 Tax=Lentibacillus amyloliquefaciens TaxID=1472767 RepID=A0A0U4FMD2_9BACI|nr:ABC transporter permease [Lentibacillus amyloliquefaciens]ALX48900.1 nitrate ABC transporter permease [Lentibacillus amyloliquefaciens]
MKQLLQKGWKPVLVLILLVIVWEVSTRIFQVPSWLLPAPSLIVQTGVEDWLNYQHHIVSTVRLTLIGFVIGSSAGIVIAAVLHLIPSFREALYPLLIISQNIPVIVLAPLLVVWFGFGMLPKIIIIALVCFFPIAVSALEGFRQTDRDLLHYMKMAGAGKQQVFWKLEWPSALPYVFSGLKISATYSVMGAVISEWLGANNGIGVYMTMASSSFRTDRVFVAIIFVIILSMLFFALIMLAEKKIIKWKRKGDE